MYEVERRVTQRQAMHCGPQVDDVALLTALPVEALEDVGVQVDAEGLAASVAAVQWARAALLGALSPQPAGQAHDCLASCLAGCCSSTAVPPCGASIVHTGATNAAPVAAPALVVALRPSVTGSHRSRAPPLG